jgi:hypothetical protein
MPFSQVNWIAVVIGSVFNMILGALWYGPFFGNLWLKLIARKREELQSSPSMYIFSFIAGFASALVLALVVKGFGAATWYMGLLTGVVVWTGIGAAATLTTALFDPDDKNKGAWLLFALYQLAVFAAEGALFAIW